MSVYLCSGDTLMPHHLLHRAQICTRVEQVRGEGVAQGMGGESGAFVHLREPADDRVLHAFGTQPRAALTEKARGAIGSHPDLLHERVAHALVLPQRTLRVITDRDDPFFAPLATHLHLPGEQVEIRTIDAAQLAEAKPGGIEELEHREVADVGILPLTGARGGGLEECLDLRAVQMPGKMLLRLWRPHGARRIGFDLVVAVQECVEGPHGGEGAADAPLPQSLPRQVCEERAHGEPVDLSPIPVVSAQIRSQEGAELLEVAPVRRRRVGRQSALDGDVVEVAADGIGERGQARTSASGVQGRPNASATAWYVMRPPCTLRPSARGASACSASRQPRSASATAYGSVTLVSA